MHGGGRSAHGGPVGDVAQIDLRHLLQGQTLDLVGRIDDDRESIQPEGKLGAREPQISADLHQIAPLSVTDLAGGHAHIAPAVLQTAKGIAGAGGADLDGLPGTVAIEIAHHIM